MNFSEALHSAAREILLHKVRSVLSFSAISVGAASLLYTLAQTRGMQTATLRHLQLMGPGGLRIERASHFEGKGLSKGLSIDDALAIRAQFPELFMVSPRSSTGVNDLLVGGRRVRSVSIAGVDPQWRKRDWVYRLRGRFISDDDVRQAARVCVVVEPGGWVEKPYWAKFWNLESNFSRVVSHKDLLGQSALINGHNYAIVGSLRLPPRDKDPRWQKWENADILVPITVFGRDLTSGDAVSSRQIDVIKIDTGDENTIPKFQRRLSALLDARHRGEKDFEIINARGEVEEAMKEEGEYISVALTLGIVALLSGGIGILNVMLASVFSRIKEIGIRRALGAQRSDVLALFMAEAALLGLFGGFAGVTLGTIGIELIAKQARGNVADLAWYNSAALVLLSSVVAAAFAAFPAWRASRLDPVDALREEA